MQSEQNPLGITENAVPSATKSRHRPPIIYFCSIVLHAAKRCLATSTPATEPESPRRSKIIQSLAPEKKKKKFTNTIIINIQLFLEETDKLHSKLFFQLKKHPAKNKNKNEKSSLKHSHFIHFIP